MFSAWFSESCTEPDILAASVWVTSPYTVRPVYPMMTTATMISVYLNILRIIALSSPSRKVYWNGEIIYHHCWSAQWRQ